MITRARLILALRLALASTWLAAAVITHLPAPSGTPDPATKQAVRGVWTMAGDIARWLGAFVPDGLVALASPFVSDKTIHFGISFALASLWCAIAALQGRLDRRRATVVIVVLTVYAAVGEWLQSLLGRIADPGDLVANAIGAVVGTALIYVARHRVAPSPDLAAA